MTTEEPDRTAVDPGGRAFGRLPARLLLGAVATVSGVLLAAWIPASVAMPLMRDQGIFAWVGQTILRGGAPYKDAWDVKGPIVHLLYALAFAMFGQHEGAVRVFHLLQVALFAWAAYVLLEGRSARVGATLIATALAALATGGDPWSSAQPDEWAGFWMMAMLALVWRSPTLVSALVAGALVGAAAAFKPPFLLCAVVPLTMLPARRNRVAVLLGLALTLGAVAAWLGAAGAWPDAVDVLFRYDLEVARRSEPLTPLWHVLGSPSLLALQALGAVGLVSLPRSDRRAFGLLLLAGASLLVALVQRKFYVYHFAPYVQVCALLAGAGASVLGDVRRRLPMVLTSACGCAAVVVWTLHAPFDRDWNYIAWRTGQRDTERYRAEFEIRDLSRRSTEDMAARIRTLTKPGDPIYLWGFDALLYVLADRPSASRLGFSYAVAAEPDPAVKALREQAVVADLARVRPKVLVVQETDDNQLMPGGSRAALQRLPVLKATIERCYAHTYRNTDYTMYTRTTTCGSPE